MTSTRCGISAKQLERELGVKYWTAWRMFNKIRNYLMADDGADLLTGEVEADETLIGGRLRNAERRRRDALGWAPRRWEVEMKTMVFAAVERDGRVRAQVIPNSSGPTLHRVMRGTVRAGSILYTDEWSGYRPAGRDYIHRTIRHTGRIYVDGSTHTQTVDWMTLRKASSTSFRLGTGISKPLGVFCLGSCVLSFTHDEVSGYP